MKSFTFRLFGPRPSISAPPGSGPPRPPNFGSNASGLGPFRSPPARSRWLYLILYSGIIAAVFALTVLGFWTFTLYQELQTRLKQNWFQPGIEFYADPIHLTPGSL